MMLRAAFDLLAGDGESGLEIAGLDEFVELGRAGDVGALADNEKSGVGADVSQRLEAAQAEIRPRWRQVRGRKFFEARRAMARICVGR